MTGSMKSGFRCLERPMIGGRMGWPGRGLREESAENTCGVLEQVHGLALETLGRKRGNTAFIWL